MLGGNTKGKRQGANAREPSLLAGLLVDEFGNALTATGINLAGSTNFGGAMIDDRFFSANSSADGALADHSSQAEAAA